MANAPRSDEAVSGRPQAMLSRRWLLVIVAVLAPITLGALATVVLYVTRPQPVVPRPAAVQATADLKGQDGSILVLQPRNTGQVRIPLASSVEVVLLPGLGETITSTNPDILMATTNPPCHLTTICGFPGARVWTFRATHVGIGYLEIIFGFRICQVSGCVTTPYVYKPFAVFAHPQAS